MKIGTIGTGMIVEKILEGVAAAEGVSCGAVYSRSRETGAAFAEKFGVENVYTDMEAFLSDPELDIIYVASPNGLHGPQAKMALEHGKHVWLEKPFTPTLREAEELFDLAEKQDRFLLEAITTQSIPTFKTLQKLLPRIGRVKVIQCCYNQYSSRYDQLLAGELTNVFDPAFYGGALMDINVYNISFVVSLFGKPEESAYYANCHENGVDTSGSLVMRYPDFVCVCEGGKDTWGVNFAQIYGENGYLYVKDGANWFSEVLLETKDVQKGGDRQWRHEEGGCRRIDEQDMDRHWHYEVRELADIIRTGNREEYRRRKRLSLDVVEILEKARPY